jgi:hypothetical protein
MPLQEHGTTLPYFEVMYKRHGGICHLLLPFGLSMVLVHDPELVKDILDRRTPHDFERDKGTRALHSRSP